MNLKEVSLITNHLTKKTENTIAPPPSKSQRTALTFLHSSTQPSAQKERPVKKNVVLYLSLWHNAWKELHADVSKDDLQKRIHELEEAIRKMMAENEELRQRKHSLKLSVNTLSESLTVLTEETHTVEVAKDELSTQLLELQETYDLERQKNEEQIKNLMEQISLSSASSEEQLTQLQNQIQEATKDRDALLEELRKLREGLQQENEEMSKKNQALGRKLVDLKKSREDVESSLAAKQELQGKYVNNLRKLLLRHVFDMHTWKDFLEFDMEYDSEGLHIVMEGVLADLTFKEQVVTLENAIQEETEILARLLVERKEEANLAHSSTGPQLVASPRKKGNPKR